MEALLKKGYEVVYFTDVLDEYVVQHLMEYDGMKLSDASKDGLKLTDKDEKEKKRDKQLKEEFKDLTKWWKEVIGDSKVGGRGQGEEEGGGRREKRGGVCLLPCLFEPVIPVISLLDTLPCIAPLSLLPGDLTRRSARCASPTACTPPPAWWWPASTASPPTWSASARRRPSETTPGRASEPASAS